MKIKQITKPELPVSLKLAKEQLVVSHNEDDDLIIHLIWSALAACEKKANTILAVRDFELICDTFDQLQDIPLNPFFSLTSVEYTDVLDQQQNLSGAIVREDCSRFSILPDYNQSFPLVKTGYDMVTATVKVGFEEVPSDVQQAILMVLSSLYENRENEIVGTTASQVPIGVEFLLSPYMVYAV